MWHLPCLLAFIRNFNCVPWFNKPLLISYRLLGRLGKLPMHRHLDSYQPRSNGGSLWVGNVGLVTGPTLQPLQLLKIRLWISKTNTLENLVLCVVRACPLSLHLHFNIHDAHANAGQRPTCWHKYLTRMKFCAGSFELPAYVRDMQGRLYIIGRDSFVLTFDLLLFSSIY